MLNSTNIFDDPGQVMTQAEAAELYRRVIPVKDQIAFVLMRDAEYPGELVARLAVVRPSVRLLVAEDLVALRIDRLDALAYG